MGDGVAPEGLLERVNRMHESQFAADKLIKTMGFALGFAASLLDLDHRYGPSDTVTKGLRQLAAKFADVRYALRFHGGYSGLLIELENMKNLTFLGGWKDPRIKYLLMGQSLTLMQYYACENLAWLGWTAPEWIGDRLINKTLGTTADRLSQWSCWGWGLMCALDMWSTLLKFKELDGIESVVRQWKAEQPPEVTARNKALQRIARTRWALQLNMLRDVCFFIPNIQWSLSKNSLLKVQPEWLVQGLSLVECLVGYYTMWNGLGCSRPRIALDRIPQKFD